MAVLRIQNLTITISQKILVQHLSFEITQPAFLAIIGHNGSGKTSLFRALLNLLPYQGEIFLSSTPALLDQKNTIHFDIPAKELAVMGKFREKKLLEGYNEQDYREAAAILQKLEAGHLPETSVLRLSGGEQQLVWMAQVLLQNSDILLLDEPTQYLDVYNRKKIFSLMQGLVKEENKTVLCITHDLLNLYSMEGYLLNLSAPQPALELISRESVDRNLKILEENLESRIWK